MQQSRHACMLFARLHTLPGAQLYGAGTVGIVCLLWRAFEQKKCSLSALFALCAVKQTDSVGKILKVHCSQFDGLLSCGVMPCHRTIIYLPACALARNFTTACFQSSAINSEWLHSPAAAVASHREQPFAQAPPKLVQNNNMTENYFGKGTYRVLSRDDAESQAAGCYSITSGTKRLQESSISEIQNLRIV